jgi:hypothetical protein
LWHSDIVAVLWIWGYGDTVVEEDIIGGVMDLIGTISLFIIGYDGGKITTFLD